METYQKESMKRIRRHSQSVLQDFIIKGFKDEGRDINVRVSHACLHLIVIQCNKMYYYWMYGLLTNVAIIHLLNLHIYCIYLLFYYRY